MFHSLVFGKCLMVNVWSMTKKSFCFKNPFFTKNAIFSKIMSQSKDLFWLIQAPKISQHISRNGGATINASWKTAHDKVFYFGAKRPFFLIKWWHHQKNVIALNMYIGTNVLVYERWLVLKVRPHQRFCHSIDSHCLCMWVKNVFSTGRCHLDVMKFANIFTPFPLAVHDLSPLALWYWCNMHIQLLSFKVRCLSQRFQTIRI